MRTRALSPQTQAVLRALAAQPATWRYGYELGEQVELKSGSLYPILMRLADRDLLHPTGSRVRPQVALRATSTGSVRLACPS